MCGASAFIVETVYSHVHAFLFLEQQGDLLDTPSSNALNALLDDENDAKKDCFGDVDDNDEESSVVCDKLVKKLSSVSSDGGSLFGGKGGGLRDSIFGNSDEENDEVRECRSTRIMFELYRYMRERFAFLMYQHRRWTTPQPMWRAARERLRMGDDASVPLMPFFSC